MNRSLTLLICTILAGCSNLSVRDSSGRNPDSAQLERGRGSRTEYSPRRNNVAPLEDDSRQTTLGKTNRKPRNPSVPVKTAPLPTQEGETSAPEPVEDQVAVGFASIAAQPGTDATEKRLQAVRASRLDAYRTLAEQVLGLEFRIEYKTVDGKITDELFQTRSQGVIRGAEVLSVEPLGSDQYQATVRLRAADVRRLRESFARGTQSE